MDILENSVVLFNQTTYTNVMVIGHFFTKARTYTTTKTETVNHTIFVSR